MPVSLEEQLDSMAAAGIAAAREREKEEEREARKRGIIPLKQLPLWPEPERSAPSVVLRSALFRTTKSNKGSFYDAQVAVWKNYNIKFTGIELSQPHLDVWLQALHMSKQQLGTKIVFTVRGFLKSIGRKGTGSRDRDWLKNALTVLSANTIVVSRNDKSQIYGGSLIHSFALEGDHCYLEINPDIIPLFDDGYTKLAWDERLKLKGNITKWLHAYICSHKATQRRPSQICIIKLKELCGSESAEIRSFRRNVKKAMLQLQDIGTVNEWNIDNDVLSFVRPPTRTSTVNGIKEIIDLLR